MKRRRIPKASVEIIYGQTGGGKSYRAVREIVAMVLEGGRPVYTNLPIKFRVMRAYLKAMGAGYRADYVSPITREQLQAAIYRAVMVGRLRDQGLSAGEIISKLGPQQDDVRKPGFNWLPLGSCLVIDEVHRWFPPGGVKLDEVLLSYTTMHRHFLHHIILISQHPMQIGLEFRRLAHEYHECYDRSRMEFLWGIRFPLQCFGVRTVPAIYYTDGRRAATIPPGEEKFITVFPWFCYRTYFRLYSSHTHAGSLGRMSRQLRDRCEAIESQAGDEQPRRWWAMAAASVALAGLCLSLPGIPIAWALSVLLWSGDVVHASDGPVADPPPVVEKLPRLDGVGPLSFAVGGREFPFGPSPWGYVVPGEFGSVVVTTRHGRKVWALSEEGKHEQVIDTNAGFFDRLRAKVGGSEAGG